MAISIGIVCGAGFYELAIVASLIITLAILGLELTPIGNAGMILVINCDSIEREKEILGIVKESCKKASIKSRNDSVA